MPFSLAHCNKWVRSTHPGENSRYSHSQGGVIQPEAVVIDEGEVAGSLVPIEGEEGQMQPAFIQHNSGGVVDVLYHGFRQEGLLTWVLRHHFNEGLGLISEGFRVGHGSVSGFRQALLHVAHFAADLVPLFLVDLRQVGVKIAGEGDEGRGLQTHLLVIPAAALRFGCQGGQGGRILENIMQVQHLPGG